jgi:hypothetical protein
MDERMSGVSHGGERGKTGTRMGGGTKERRKKKKRGRGGTHEQRSGEVEMEEWRSGGAEGSAARRGTRENGDPNGRRSERKGEEERGGGKWGSEEVKERRYLFRHKRATDLAEAEESRARGWSRRAGGTLRFAVSGAGRPFVEGEERTTPCRTIRQGVVYAVADAGVRVRASCGFPSEGPAC